MEEHAKRCCFWRFSGLLTLIRHCAPALLACLLAFAGQQGFAASSHAAYLHSLSFKCQEGYIFSSTNTVFSVDIAYLAPEDVSVYLNSIPNNVELVSIKKVTYIPPANSAQGYGTHVEITVRFSSTGDVKLFSADLECKEGFFKIPFPTVHVWANMQILKPELDVSVAGYAGQSGLLSSSVGSHIRYTVRVKYAASVRSISYDIPENSIFVESERIMDPDSFQSQTVDFSPNFRDVARYDWQPLIAGDFELPTVKLVVQSYSGNLITLPFPSVKVRVQDSDSLPVLHDKEPLPNLFEDSFAESPYAQLPVVGLGSQEDAMLLASLYSREIGSFPFIGHVRKDRQGLEERLGRDVHPALPSRPFFFCLIFLSVLTLVIMLVLIFRRFFAKAAFVLVIVLLLCTCTVAYAIRLSRRIAVAKGGTLYPIPEAGLSQGTDLPSASVLFILKETGTWYYVTSGDTNGWVSSDDVILVR
ncbi:MAG: hypothetical protein IJU95_08815 [Treponema sp.]|nr:hypothetical protein [Treponema sp.]